MSQSHDKFLTLEDFFATHQSVVTAAVGEKVAQMAWALKDLDPSSEEAEYACRRVQKALAPLLENRDAEWVIDVSESHTMIDLDSWIEHGFFLGKAAAKENETGYPDLDLNLETQMVCGAQMEAFHEADWAKKKLLAMMEPDSFEPMEPMIKNIKFPLPNLIATLDRDLSIGVRGLMRHPHSCSVAIGAISLRLGPKDGKPEEMIPLVRRVRFSEIGDVVRSLKDDINARRVALVETIHEQQEHLKALPENWPTPEIWQKMQEMATLRFKGDSGLMGSDFFEGNWLMMGLPGDVHRKSLAPTVKSDEKLRPLEDLGSRLLQKRSEQHVAHQPTLGKGPSGAL